jgi:predicted amidohydrolase
MKHLTRREWLSTTSVAGVGLLSLRTAANAAPKPAAQIRPLTTDQIAHKTARVAAVQITGPWNWQVPTGEHNDPAKAIIPYIDRAGKDQADLVVFPELYLGMFQVPSPQTEAIATAAKRNNVYVMVGCFEVIDAEGNYGNSTLIFDRDGKILGRYFKAYQAVGGPPNCWPPKSDDPEWLMTPGEKTPVFDLDFGRVGILTCYDGYFPEMFRLLSLKGAEIIIWPNARQGTVEDFIVKTNVHQNYVHMITTNKAIGAGTMIAAWPRGVQKQLAEAKEDYIMADLDLATLRHGRIHAREFRQRRPAMFAELAHNYSVAEMYGVKESDVAIPEPSATARKAVLENSGINISSTKTR